MAASSRRNSASASDAIQPAARELESVGGAPDDIYETLIESVRAAGGSKVVAAELWPAVAARNLDEARRRLANCLSPERAEKLSLDEIVQIARLSRARGCHVFMQFLAADLGYAVPQPVEPRDEIAELLRTNNELRAQLLKSSERIERLLATPKASS